MGLSVERLRWVLAGGTALLVLVVVGFLAYGRYRAVSMARDIEKKLGVHITHESNNVTYSQTVKGKTLYTLRAAKAIQRSDGKYTLRDAELTLFSRTSDRVDHIYGSEFEYDPQQGIARAVGEVHMDLEAPEGIARPESAPQKIRGREGRAPSAARSHGEDTQTIHVRTSGLVYIKSLGIAATEEDVEIRYGGIEAHAHGADFDQAASTVHLLAAVRMNGELHGHAVDLVASRADLDRDNNFVAMTMPVITSEGRKATAHTATAHLRRDGSVALVDAAGDVTFGRGTQQVAGQQFQAELNEKSVPLHATLSGAVVLNDSNALRPVHGSAQKMDAVFDAAGQVKTLVANGQTKLQSRVQASGVWLDRSVEANTMTVAMTPHGRGTGPAVVNMVHAVGAAQLRSMSLMAPSKGTATTAVAETKLTTMVADDMTASFAPEEGSQPQPQEVVGKGHVRLQQDAPRGEQQVTTADNIDIHLAKGAATAKPSTAKSPATPAGFDAGVEITYATEDGHVRIHTRAAQHGNALPAAAEASSEHASYSGTTQRLVLSGSASFRENGIEVASRQIAMDQATGDAEATGDVAATVGSEHGASSHVMADRATLAHDSRIAEFFGSDAHPARLWQQASQILAADLLMDGEQKTLAARPQSPKGLVTALFSGQGSATQPGKPGAAAAAPRTVRVSSPRMDYADTTHDAVFSGGVTMHASQGDIRAQRVVLFLKPKTVSKEAPGSALTAADPSASSIERAVASGDVHFAEPGRSGTGDQLLYTAATDEFVLTGTPAKQPRIVDAAQGNVTGSTLVFTAGQGGTGDNTVVVAADPAAGKHSRVRTETEVARPQK